MKELFTEVHPLFELKAQADSDLMKLFINVKPNGKNPVTKKELLEVLFRKMDTERCDHGVLDDVARLLSEGQEVKERRIMKGIEPQPGHDGKVLLLLKKYTGEGHVEETKTGAVNLRDLHLFDNILKGTIVGRIYPPKPGTPGKDVTGKAIAPAAVKPVKISLDKTLKLERRSGDEFEVIVSEEEGYLFGEGDMLQIRSDLKIGGNIDFRVGSIDFIGSVEVQGDVLPGMAVRAKKGIVVRGNAQEAILESSQGDIVVHGFLHGAGKGKVVSGKNITARVAHAVRLDAIGTITIAKEAVDCDCLTQTTFSAIKANIVGGLTRVVCGAEAAVWGNEAGKHTEIELCSSIEATTEFAQLQSSLAQHDKALKMLELHLGPYATSPTRVKLLREPFKGKMEQLLEKHKSLSFSKATLKRRREDMLKGAIKNPIQRINAQSRFSSGVVIKCSDKLFEVTDAIAGPTSVTFHPDKQEFSQGKLEAIVCEVSAVELSKTEKKK